MEGSRILLLGIDAVRDELKLTDEQKSELTKVITAWDEERRSLGLSSQNLSQDERTKRLANAEEKTKAAWEKCEKILTGEQVERVKQIIRHARRRRFTR